MTVVAKINSEDRNHYGDNGETVEALISSSDGSIVVEDIVDDKNVKIHEDWTHD